MVHYKQLSAKLASLVYESKAKKYLVNYCESQNSCNDDVVDFFNLSINLSCRVPRNAMSAARRAEKRAQGPARVYYTS